MLSINFNNVYGQSFYYKGNWMMLLASTIPNGEDSKDLIEGFITEGGNVGYNLLRYCR